MKKLLTKTQNHTYYFKEGVTVLGVHEKISGDVSDISGDVSGIYGNVSGIYGNVSGCSGDVSGIYGNVSGIYGNLDDCELTPEEREAGVNISDLMQ